MPWPSTLPKLALTEDFEEIPGDASYRTETDSGPARTRPRPDAPNDQLMFKQVYRSTEIDLLRMFYHDTLIRGSLTFKEFHPRTGDEMEFRFTVAPRFVRNGGLYFAMFTLEIMP